MWMWTLDPSATAWNLEMAGRVLPLRQSPATTPLHLGVRCVWMWTLDPSATAWNLEMAGRSSPCAKAQQRLPYI